MQVEIVHGSQWSFVIKKACSCKTSGLVYYISCRLCPAIYIGETGRTLRQRFSVHLRGIEKELLGFPVAELFNLVGHSINDARNYALRRKRLTQALKG